MAEFLKHFSAYERTDEDEEGEKHMLFSEGYQISDPIVVDGIHIGFLAVKFNDSTMVEEALYISVLSE